MVPETIAGSTASKIASKDLPFHIQTQKRKVKEKPFNFLLHRFEIEINHLQMKSTIESKRELNKSKATYIPYP